MSRIGVCSAPAVHASTGRNLARHFDARTTRTRAQVVRLPVQSGICRPGQATKPSRPARRCGAWRKLLSTDFETANPGLRTTKHNSKDVVTSRRGRHKPITPNLVNLSLWVEPPLSVFSAALQAKSNPS